MLEGGVGRSDRSHSVPVSVLPTNWVSFENDHSKMAWLFNCQIYVLEIFAY